MSYQKRCELKFMNVENFSGMDWKDKDSCIARFRDFEQSVLSEPRVSAAAMPHSSRLESALVWLGAWCIHLASRVRARRAICRWSTPEEEAAYRVGVNRGAALSALYCTALISLIAFCLLLQGGAL